RIVSACVGSLAAVLAGALLGGGGSVAASTVVSDPVAVTVAAIFHARHVRTQREFLVSAHPWRDFILIAAGEWLSCAGVAAWAVARLPDGSAGGVVRLG